MAQARGLNLSNEVKLDMMTKPYKYTRSYERDSDLIQIATFIQEHVHHEEKDDYLVDIINSIHDWEYLYKDYSLSTSFRHFLQVTDHNYKIQEALRDRTSEIVDDLFLSENEIFKAVDLLEQMKETFNIDFTEYDTTRIKRHLDELFSEHIFNETDWLMDWITDESEAYDKRHEIRRLNERIVMLDIDYEADMIEFERDWDEIARENEFRRLMEKDD